MGKLQRVNSEGRDAIRARERELSSKDLDDRNKQTEQWKTKRVLDSHVKNVK